MSPPALFLALLVAAPPTYLVERLVTAPGKDRRLSVFRDGNTVLALRDSGGEQKLLRGRLKAIEQRVLVQVLQECYDGLHGETHGREGFGDAWQELRLAPPGREPLVVRIPIVVTPSQAAARLGQALDELENLLASSPPQREDLDQWYPRVGDRLELDDGRVVEVTEVLESAEATVIRVRVGDSPLIVVMDLPTLRQHAVRRVER